MVWYSFKNGHPKDLSLKEIEMHVQNVITILDSITSIIAEEGGGWDIWSFNEHENLHFDNELDIHVRYENYKESDYNLNLDLLNTSY